MQEVENGMGGLSLEGPEFQETQESQEPQEDQQARAAQDEKERMREARRRLTPSQRHILAHIKASGEEGCFCSKATIADNLAYSLKTVDRAVARLRKEGFITAEARYSDTGAQLPNVYRISDQVLQAS